MKKVDFIECWWCKHPLAWLPDPNHISPVTAADEDSLSTQDMADIEDGKPLLFDESRHKRHVCR